MARSHKEDSESDDEQHSNTRSSKTISNPKSHIGFSRPPLSIKQTPVRPKSVAPPSSSSSSSSSCSTVSSLCDDSDLDGAGTPFTPPLSETPVSTNSGKSRLSNAGRASLLSFDETSSSTNKTSFDTNTPATTPASKRSYRSSSVHELANEHLERPNFGDDELSAGFSGLSLEDSQSPSVKADIHKKKRRAAKRSLENLSVNGQSGRTSKAKEVPLTIEMMDQIDNYVSSAASQVEPKDLRALNNGKHASSSGSVKEKDSRTIPSIVAYGDNEGQRMVEDRCSMTTHSMLVPDEQQGPKSTSLAPGAGHKRSNSAPRLHDESKIIVLGDSKSPGNSVSPRSKHAPDSLSVPTRASGTKSRRTSTGKSTSKPRKPRRRSTGSLEAGEVLPTSVEPLIPDVQEPGHEPSTEKSARSSRASKRTPPSATPNVVPTTEPETVPAIPKMEDFGEERDQNDLKLGILEAIAGRKVSKRIRIQALRTQLKNAWKEWIDSAQKPVRTSPNEDDGYIYIFRSNPNAYPGEGYFKIGVTKQTPEERRKEWQAKCKFEFIHIKDEKDKRFLHCQKAERIIHAELWNKRKKFKCPVCKRGHKLELREEDVRATSTEHGEWFEISEDEALKVVNKWRNWIIQTDPYKPDGRLHARWSWKCAAGSLWMNGTEEDWVAWREFDSLETFRFILHHVQAWLSRLLPPMIEILMIPGAIFWFAPLCYFLVLGVNLGSCLAFLTAVFVFVYMGFRHG